MLYNDGIPTQVDKSQFEVGKNLAASAGQVIYRAEMFELIQYAPTKPRLYKTPLLVVGSYVNRFYLVDLMPDRSMVEYMVTNTAL